MIFMLFFRNDYGKGCIPEILEALQNTNENDYEGYGLDTISKQAKELISSHMPDHNPDIHFIHGGTATNLTMIRSMLRSYQAIIACDSAHIATHETGAIEATGHKVITVANKAGKLTPESIRKAYDEHMLTYEHMVYPKAIYISNSTEYGTVYSKQELIDLRAICDELDLYLVMDGARLGVALVSGVDYTLHDLPNWVDIFTIGATKNGALFGEAVVIVNEELKEHFRFVMKQSGSMLAKGWLIGLQFLTLFQENRFFDIAMHENNMAQAIQDGIDAFGYPMFMKTNTNQIFPIVTKEQFQFLSDKISFEVWEKRENSYVIRFVTGFFTKKEDVVELLSLLKKASQL